MTARTLHSTSPAFPYGFDNARLRADARRQLGLSMVVLASFGLACAVMLAM